MGNIDNEKEKRGLFKLIDIIAHNYSKLMGVNLLYTVCSLPVIAVYMLLTSIISSSFFESATENFDITVTMFGGMMAVYLFLMLGGGPASPGFTFVIRSIARREPVFVASDFFEHIKKNFKQSIVIILMDAVVIGILFFNINAIMIAPDIFFGLQMPFGAVTVVIFILYFGARMYLYPLMVTYKEPLKGLIKNSLLLSLIEMPKNIFYIVLSSVIYYLFSLLPFPFFVFFAVPIAMMSLVEIIRMVYTCKVIEKYIVAAPKDENDDENTGI